MGLCSKSWTDTLKKHTAMNASKEERLHLVVSLLKDK